jgi:hypothetical protein
MQEIWIPEIIITIFIIIFLVRPFIKKLWPLDGLVWLPVLALIISIGMFPAYGFRPELIPLLVFEFVLTIITIPLLISSAFSIPNDNFRDWNPIFSVLALILMTGALAVMFIFSPKVPPGLTSEGVEIRSIRDEKRNLIYFVRIYAAGGENSGAAPRIFLIPPEAGSIPAVDRVCAALRDRGFTVVSYSRRGLDFPAVGEKNRRYLVSPGKIRAYWQAFRQGTELKKANDLGKALEVERLRDLEFLLPRTLEAAKTPLFLAGYGAGGTAAVLFAGNAGLSRRFPQLRGLIAVESRFWSAYRSDPPALPQIPEGAPWYLRFRIEAARWFAGLKPRRITGFEAPPPSGVPLLALISDRARNGNPDTQEPYRALLETLRRTPAGELASLTGAGPLDYSVYPLSHPLYSFLFPGLSDPAQAKRSADPIGGTADVICNFIVPLCAETEY